jgi:hypothetical protein
MLGFVRTQEKKSSQYFSSFLTNTQVLYNCTQHSRQVFYLFYKMQIIVRSFAHDVGSYKEHATANQIARNMSVIL